MGAGEGILHPPELVHDPLALFPGARGASLDCTPAGNDPGNALPVADGLRCVYADKVADDLVDDRGLFKAAEYYRDCPDKERVATKFFKDETFEGKHRQEVCEDRGFLRGAVQDHRADQFLRGPALHELAAHLLVEDTFMGCMLVDEEQLVPLRAGKDIDPPEFPDDLYFGQQGGERVRWSGIG
jgi:hypothetical protein